MRKAVIESGIVRNIIECGSGGVSLPAGQMLVPCDGYMLAIGDRYDGAGFYRDGEKLLPVDKNKEMARLLGENAEVKAALAALLGTEETV